MTTEPNALEPSKAEVILPDDLLFAQDRIAQHRARALRSINQQQRHRRFLPAAIVGSALLVAAGLADRFVQAAVRSTVISQQSPVVTVPNTTDTRSLASITQILAADQRTIAALAQAQAQYANSSVRAGGSSVALPNIQLPNLPSLPALPSTPPPTVAASPPATHATTGASVVVP
jgi:hypothetical protein